MENKSNQIQSNERTGDQRQHRDRRNYRGGGNRQQTGGNPQRGQFRGGEGVNKKKIKYTCWRCHRDFESENPLPRDGTRCPFCDMIHGQITTDTFSYQ